MPPLSTCDVMNFLEFFMQLGYRSQLSRKKPIKRFKKSKMIRITYHWWGCWPIHIKYLNFYSEDTPFSQFNPL